MYRHIGIAAALSPRLEGLLAEVALHLGGQAPRVSLIHAGAPTDGKEARLREAAENAGLPAETEVFWSQGAPDDAILRVVESEGVDLLVAGALEKERPMRYYLGSVAHNLVREAPCSLMLFTEPSPEPEPMRRLLLVTDYSENSLIALARTVRFAEHEQAEVIHVVRVVSQYGEAMALADGMKRERAKAYQTASLAEEQTLLRDFVDAAGKSKVPIEARVVEGHGGVVVARLARELEAELLVMPSANQSQHFFTRLFPSDMEWVLREIPCNLWVIRERLPVG